MSKQFDVVVIGAGPGGYIAAIRAAQLGMSVACIDAWQNGQGGPAPGGTCTNVGCIPSKALLQSSEHFEQANHHFAEHGIEVKGVSLKLDTLIGRKNSVVKQNNDGILYLFKKNKVTFFHGKGAFSGQVDGGWAIKVTGTTEEDLVAKHVVVATGSSARELPGLPFDEGRAVQRRCTEHRRRAQDAGRDRRGCDRPGNGQRVAPPGFRKSPSWKRCRNSWPPLTRRWPRKP